MSNPNQQQIEERFWSKVNKNGPVPAHAPHLGNCWEWRTSKPNTYGTFWNGHKIIRAHRFSYEITTGKIGADQIVMHDCDNPRCVNPKHLTRGTQVKNMKDCLAKGRHQSITKPDWCAKGENNGTYTHPETVRKGESVNTAKLVKKDVIKIRELNSTGLNCEVLAHRYRVDPTTIQRIIQRKSWKHIL